MATPHEFMERVVVWPGLQNPGHINLHWPWKKEGMTKPVFLGLPYKDVHSFMAEVQQHLNQDVYFCLSTQSETGTNKQGKIIAKRRRDNALFLKAIWLDIDVGKKDAYVSVEEAIKEVLAFAKQANIPIPSAVVRSGGGVHVYWISDTPLSIQEWRHYAEGLRRAAEAFQLRCDGGLTTDAARVLRVPGTSNWKTGHARPVRLVYLGDDYTFPVVFGKFVTGPVTVATPQYGAPAAAFQGLTDSLAPPPKDYLDATEVLKQCKHFNSALRTGGVHDSQGLWQLTLLGCTFFKNGRTIAHALSDKYPTYSQAETDAKFDEKLRVRQERKLGWPSCRSFEREGAACKTCPLYSTLYAGGKSPLHLTMNGGPPPPLLPPAPAGVPPQGTPPTGLMLPPGYQTNAAGHICGWDSKTKKWYEVFLCQLRNPVLEDNPKAFTCETSLDTNNGALRWGPVRVLESEISTEPKLQLALRKRWGVKPYETGRRLTRFMTSWIAQIDAAVGRTTRPSPFGWVGSFPDFTGFSYGGISFMSDGTQVASGGLEEILADQYNPTGTDAAWWDLFRRVTKQHHPALEVIVAASFAAPLMELTGQHSGLFHAWSPGSASHKSTSLELGCAVWGNPHKTKHKPTATEKGLGKKLNDTRNMPAYWDEISKEDSLEKIADFLGSMTEGGHGDRLKNTREFHDLTSWHSLVLVGANLSLVDFIHGQSATTDSRLRRVFEFQVEKRGDTEYPPYIDTLRHTLEYNYGVIGLKYAEWLGTHPQEARTEVQKALAEFYEAAGASSEDRFRTAMAACINAGAAIANRYLGTDFNIDEIKEFLVVHYKKQGLIISEHSVAGSELNTLDAMSAFFKDGSLNTVWVAGRPGEGRQPISNRLDQRGHANNQPINIRCVVRDKVIDVSKQALLDYFTKHNRWSGQQVIQGLEQYFGAITGRLNLSAGIAGRNGAREHVICIPVTTEGHPFEELLYKEAPVDMRPPHLQPLQMPAVTVSVTGAAASTQTPLTPTGLLATTFDNRPE